MKISRRDFFTLLGGTAFAWPLTAGARQPTMPVVGFLNGQTAAGFTHLVAAFRQGLGEAGFNEGQNVRIEYRWADGNVDRVQALAEELIRLRVAVIAATGGAHSMVRDAATTIPIVATFGDDPVKLGLVASINRPGGTLTGVSVFTSDLEAKRLELLHELVAKDAIIGVLLDPTFSDGRSQLKEFEAAAHTLGRQIRMFNISADDDINGVFAAVAEKHIAALAVAGNPLFFNRLEHLLAQITRLRIPAVFENREFTRAGGLMSYGTNVPDVYRQVGVYTGRILKGEKAADLPVLQPTKFDISVNLKTARSLGLDVPTSVLLRADEVIE